MPTDDRRPLRGFELHAPQTWVALPVGLDPPAGWEHEAAALLVGADDQARATFVREVRTVRPTLVDRLHLSVGVWVPNPATGEIAGGLVLDLIVPDPGSVLDRAHYRSLIDPDPRKKLKVYARVIEEVDLPAGPALRVREAVGRRVGWVPVARVYEETCTHIVFPPECTEAVMLTCTTPLEPLGERLAEEAALAAENLVVLVED